MDRDRIERWVVRAIVAVGFAVALIASVELSIPTHADGSANLPAVALGQEVVYRLEVLLATSLGGLLVVTPVFEGVVRGRLPLEVTARGARYAESETLLGQRGGSGRPDNAARRNPGRPHASPSRHPDLARFTVA
jgi:hypothetical protein